MGILMEECADICKDKDQETFDAHFKTQWFTVLGKAIPEENLLAAPLDIKTIKPFGGLLPGCRSVAAVGLHDGSRSGYRQI
jgi:hypothetical protein